MGDHHPNGPGFWRFPLTLIGGVSMIMATIGDLPSLMTFSAWVRETTGVVASIVGQIAEQAGLSPHPVEVIVLAIVVALLALCLDAWWGSRPEAIHGQLCLKPLDRWQDIVARRWSEVAVGGFLVGGVVVIGGAWKLVLLLVMLYLCGISILERWAVRQRRGMRVEVHVRPWLRARTLSCLVVLIILMASPLLDPRVPFPSEVFGLPVGPLPLEASGMARGVLYVQVVTWLLVLILLTAWHVRRQARWHVLHDRLLGRTARAAFCALLMVALNVLGLIAEHDAFTGALAEATGGRGGRQLA